MLYIYIYIYICRQVLGLNEGKLAGAQRPLKSIFGNRCGYAVVIRGNHLLV